MEPDDLFAQYQQGRVAEQHLATLPPQPDPDEDIAHRATLLHLAIDGRRAEKTILARPELAQTHGSLWHAVNDTAQEEQDQQIAAGLASGQLVIASPEDNQRLASNANARAKFRNSPHLSEEEKANLIAQTFANDTAIRRAALPVPPEQQAQSPPKKLRDLYAQMPPDVQRRLQGVVVHSEKGVPQLMRGYKEPVGQPPASPPDQGQHPAGSHPAEIPGMPGARVITSPHDGKPDIVQWVNGEWKAMPRPKPEKVEHEPDVDREDMKLWMTHESKLRAAGKPIKRQVPDKAHPGQSITVDDIEPYTEEELTQRQDKFLQDLADRRANRRTGRLGEANPDYTPEIDTDTPPTPPQQPQGPVKIASQEDFDQLPSGAVFIGPDGLLRRKP
jgi:hypothetical protein